MPGRSQTSLQNSKLSAQDVYAIRRWASAQTRTGFKQIAARYGVTTQTISDVIARRSWQHLPKERRYWPMPPATGLTPWWLTVWIFLALWRQQLSRSAVMRHVELAS